MSPVPKITTIKLNSITAATKWKHMGSRSKAIFDQLNEKGFYDNYNLNTVYNGLKRFTGTKIHSSKDIDGPAAYFPSRDELKRAAEKAGVEMPLPVYDTLRKTGVIGINKNELRGLDKNLRKQILLHEQLESLFSKKGYTAKGNLLDKFGHTTGAVLFQERKIPKLMGYHHKSNLTEGIDATRDRGIFLAGERDKYDLLKAKYYGTEKALHKKLGKKLDNMYGRGPFPNTPSDIVNIIMDNPDIKGIF